MCQSNYNDCSPLSDVICTVGAGLCAAEAPADIEVPAAICKLLGICGPLDPNCDCTVGDLCAFLEESNVCPLCNRECSKCSTNSGFSLDAATPVARTFLANPVYSDQFQLFCLGGPNFAGVCA